MILTLAGLRTLFAELAKRGYRVAGPRVRDGAIVYEELDSPADLPKGWTEEQDAGTYRLKKRADDALFGYTVGPHSWKKFLNPPKKLLWRAAREENAFRIQAPAPDETKWAFLGVRACELKAIEIQDRVFLASDHPDADYRALRQNAFLIAVNCTEAAKTCFCVSMGSGPGAESGFDLALTEIIDGADHYFIAEAGSERGRELMRAVPHSTATAEQQLLAQKGIDRAAAQMGRTLDTAGLAQTLKDNLEHPRWNEVASRCMACANCTMVCPTCFCSTVEDVTDLSGDHAERWQKWDSCFTMDFTYIHGGNVRQSTKSRYRQWMTHKLSNWEDQFGTSGCVGCGRCVAWCPVGIDITQEAAAIRARPVKPPAGEA